MFEDADGQSVAIARTERGHRLLLAAQAAGVISLEPVDLNEVAKIQPLQVDRKRAMFGRVWGTRFSFRSAPSFPGFELFRLAIRYPKLNFKGAVGTFLRSLKKRKSKDK